MAVEEGGCVMKRLQNELLQLLSSTTESISAFPVDDNDLTYWVGYITGPKDTPYSGLKFKVSLKFPQNYPFHPPMIKFLSPMWHPNVDKSGNICLDILKEKWSAVYNVETILLSLQSLLGEPNNRSPLNAVAAELWDADMEEYRKKVLTCYEEIDDY
ncbi:CCT_1a_G0052870.mRNA.1.CDS.1 [Saccharomyces cerevisiae]|nr:CCT_1a_G0052870.mRNA.1.CDS.1 [Saccharomyces cerevisiae]CAI7472904.1 CCT_1a_G0052870.mRNA.1.CDS.1 [Saccharomyces cerevisiae]